PSETRRLVSTRLESPPWTKPTSTLTCGSARRFRFSSDPSDGRISSVTPLRSRILRYLSAEMRPALPSGPLVMTMVPGGAGRTKWTAIQMATTLTSRTGPSDAARSRHEIRWIRREKRSGAFSRVPPSSAIRILPAAWQKEWPRGAPRSAVGAGHVQPHGRANESLQCLLVDSLALVEVDGTSRVAIEARVEEARW